ncbi:MAG TPA: acyltransferase domain-containing protein [Acidimicrobiales bacterium]|nr:acyltransferase domain-containing protein [Acidimicrobiales bacterium]
MSASLGPGAEQVADRLGIRPGTFAHLWLAELEAVGPPPPELAPEPLTEAVAAERLALLGVPEADAADVLATLPHPGDESWWCLEREVHRLVAAMGDPDARRGVWPSFEGERHPVALRCHFIHVALATMPFTLAWRAARGEPEATAIESLADVARHMAIHRRVHGCTGIEAAWWVTLALRAELTDLGRLQFNRLTLQVSDQAPPWYPPEVAAEMGPGFRPGDPCLGIHIPEGAPLDHAAVEASLERAAEYFGRHYPVGQRRVATCVSWLLDDQLADYLPETSNIVMFQRRFELLPGFFDGDASILEFVFRVAADHPLDRLAQRTTLERAVVAHLRAGRHWRVRTGWLDLPVASAPR